MYVMGVMEKIAATAAQRVEAHHASDVKDWSAFEKSLKSKAFNKAVQLHPASDDKLKRYSDQNHKYLKSKRVAGEELSATSTSKYEIKALPGGGLGCGCKDWQYKRSHQGGDCKHIRAFKAKLQQPKTIAPGKLKLSSFLRGLNGGLTIARTFEKAEKNNAKARLTQEHVRQLRAAGYGR